MQPTERHFQASPGLPFEKGPHNPEAGVALSDAPSTWNFPSCTIKSPAPGTNICYKNLQNLHKMFFPTTSGTHHHCSWAQHGKPSTIQDRRGCNPPSGHSFPHPWNGPELTLWSIFDHYLGQVLLLLLLAQPAYRSSLWETVPLDMRKHQHRPLVEFLY